MPTISYAQNREDVRLMRAFGKQKHGFYIDVGAHDPVTFSITKHFYDRGWKGLNLEAATGLAERLTAARPRDTTLNVGVSNSRGSMTFYEAARASEGGLSTFSADEVAVHRKAGIKFFERRIETITLRELCEQHVTGPIDFMSVDVEGHERQVLEGADFHRFRPKVLVIEATRPLTPVPTHHLWEDLLLAARYEFAAFDGLNRFYVSEESRELKECLEVSPNPFDEYVPYEYQYKIAELERELAYYRASKRTIDLAASLLNRAVTLIRPKSKSDTAR